MPATVESVAEALRAFASRRRQAPPDLAQLDPSRWSATALAVTKLVWARRVVNETQSVEVAEHLRTAFEGSGLLSPAVEGACTRLRDDERAHAELAAAFLARLGAPIPEGAPSLVVADESPTLFLLRCVSTGLAVCETVSAVRFAVVRRHTDVSIARACIELFLRDEIAHARLGFALLPVAIAAHAQHVGLEGAARELRAELRATFRHLDVVVGLDAERRGVRLEARPQPVDNAGVVEPVLDALAFYDAVTHTVLPRLARIGIDATPIWTERWRPADRE